MVYGEILAVRTVRIYTRYCTIVYERVVHYFLPSRFRFVTMTMHDRPHHPSETSKSINVMIYSNYLQITSVRTTGHARSKKFFFFFFLSNARIRHARNNIYRIHYVYMSVLQLIVGPNDENGIAK